MTVTEYIRAHAMAWVDAGPMPSLWPDLPDLRQTEWSPEFERLMRNRLIVGGGRYGWLNEPGKKQWHRTDAIIARAQKYQDTGNTELLVDIANLALLEFEEGTHPNKHFRSIDSEQDSHVKEAK